MSPCVSVGVPIYRGEEHLEEALRSIQQQTHRDLRVLMSVDGRDPVCEAICHRFLDDSRFSLVIQPERLGWVGHFNWLTSHAEGDFWYFHQQDDLVAETYVETLLRHATDAPSAALVYCDVNPFGRLEGSFEQVPSVFGGAPFARS